MKIVREIYLQSGKFFPTRPSVALPCTQICSVFNLVYAMHDSHSNSKNKRAFKF